MRFFRPPSVLSVIGLLGLHRVQRPLNVTELSNRDITTGPTSAQLWRQLHHRLTKRQVPSRLGVTALVVDGSRFPSRTAVASRFLPLAAIAIRPSAISTPPA